MQPKFNIAYCLWKATGDLQDTV